MRRSVTPRARAATSSSYTRWAIRGARPADGSSTSSSTGSFTSSFASDSIFASPRMEEAKDRLQQCRLARAVRADDAGDAARLDPERDVRKDVDALDVAGG